MFILQDDHNYFLIFFCTYLDSGLEMKFYGIWAMIFMFGFGIRDEIYGI
jgi:hypothetical protein